MTSEQHDYVLAVHSTFQKLLKKEYEQLIIKMDTESAHKPFDAEYCEMVNAEFFKMLQGVTEKLKQQLHEEYGTAANTETAESTEDEVIILKEQWPKCLSATVKYLDALAKGEPSDITLDVIATMQQENAVTKAADEAAVNRNLGVLLYEAEQVYELALTTDEILGDGVTDPTATAQYAYDKARAQLKKREAKGTAMNKAQHESFAEKLKQLRARKNEGVPEAEWRELTADEEIDAAIEFFRERKTAARGEHNGNDA